MTDKKGGVFVFFFYITLISCFTSLMFSFRSCEMEEQANKQRVVCMEKHSADECVKAVK